MLQCRIERESRQQAGAEGATAPETLRPKDRSIDRTLERGAQVASAEGITFSGERTEGASGAGHVDLCELSRAASPGEGMTP